MHVAGRNWAEGGIRFRSHLRMEAKLMNTSALGCALTASGMLQKGAETHQHPTERKSGLQTLSR